MKRIIIIGGMGPQASLELHGRILQRAVENGAVNGKDFPHIVHFSLPVHDFIDDQHKTKTALQLIVESLQTFKFNSSDTVVLACNTAHLLKDELERILHITITSMTEATCTFIAQHHSEIRLLASPTTIRTGLYTNTLRKAGVKVRVPTSKQLIKIESVIRSVIASTKVKPLGKSTVPILLGCTELSCAFGRKKGVIDPMNILIDTIMPRKEML